MRETGVRDAGVELARALVARSGGVAAVAAARERPWRSATFAGLRHVLTMAMPDGARAAFCAGIDEAEFGLRGHLVVDIAAYPGGDGVTVEALTISERA